MGQRQAQKGDVHAVIAGFLGWTLDAFDFFVVVFLVDTLAAEFAVTKKHIVWTLTATLFMRPLGALVFGALSDLYGRKFPLIANVIFYSAVGCACGFAPNYTWFFALRALYGVGMGGEWGVGASLALESAPKRLRGVLSGVLQSGYPIGFLLAALAARYIAPVWGFRAMFWVGGAPALLALYIRTKVPEPRAQDGPKLRVSDLLTIVRRNGRRLGYLVVFMTFMLCLSHGTQDLYPDFLKSAHHASVSDASLVVILCNLGAVLGSVVFGSLSEKFGRRKALGAALVLTLSAIPLWVLPTTWGVLAAGAFALQFGVQGAWGIIPAHLNELSPSSVRGLVPGLSYQLGIVFASPVSAVEYALRDRFGYAAALAGFEALVIVALLILVRLGTEARGADFFPTSVAEEG